MCHSQKSSTPKQNFFRVQTKRLADPFEPLNSSLWTSYGVDEATEKLLVLGRNLGTNMSYAGSQSVN